MCSDRTMQSFYWLATHYCPDIWFTVPLFPDIVFGFSIANCQQISIDNIGNYAIASPATFMLICYCYNSVILHVAAGFFLRKKSRSKLQPSQEQFRNRTTIPVNGSAACMSNAYAIKATRALTPTRKLSIYNKTAYLSSGKAD